MIWQRFTPQQRIMRTSIYIVTAVAVVWALKSIEVIPEFLYDAPEQTLDLFKRFYPVDWSYWGKQVRAGLIETLHTATLGTLFALVLAVPLALMAARNITASPLLRFISKLLLVSSRSVNSLVWALLFVAIFGPGALAGTLAIAFRSIGFIGKLLAEALEDVSTHPIEALLATGASKPAVLLKGYWSAVEPSFWSLALFRWDINVRESAVLGLVGAGGIGVALDSAMNNLYWDEVSLCLLVIFIVVVITELVTNQIRKYIL